MKFHPAGTRNILAQPRRNDKTLEAGFTDKMKKSPEVLHEL
jgi:hypothetical protein